MTIMSWLVVYVYSLFNAGNSVYGILAFIGICLAHLATNIFDDYFDYKSLIRQVGFDKKEYLKNSQQTKCRYIVSGRMKEWEVLSLAVFYAVFACLTGLFFYLKCGCEVLYFAIIGGVLGISYSFLSKIRLSEFAVAIAYGPALFGGIYYVMTKTIAPEVFILSIPTMLVTVILLYIHTVMDFNFDIKEGHKTIANSFKTPFNSLVILKWLLIISYLSLIVLCIFDILDWQVFIVCLTIPLAVDLYKSLEEYTINPDSIPVRKWYHFPMENMMNVPNFMTRIYQSRNLMIYFSLLLTIAVILGLG